MRSIFKNSIILVSLSILIALSSCNSGSETKSDPNLHKVTVKEITQVSGYTYLHVEDDGEKVWLAVPKMEANVGDVFYYNSGMTMTNFESRELGKTFESIIFIENISTDPIHTPTAEEVDAMHSQADSVGMPKPKIEVVNVDVEPLPEGPNVETLYKKKDSFADQVITIRGQVTKVNNNIMDLNWVHIQDGTQFVDKVDLTITTTENFEVGQIVTFEGTIRLNKDFGYGYSYELIMEEATAKE